MREAVRKNLIFFVKKTIVFAKIPRKEKEPGDFRDYFRDNGNIWTIFAKNFFGKMKICIKTEISRKWKKHVFVSIPARTNGALWERWRKKRKCNEGGKIRKGTKDMGRGYSSEMGEEEGMS